MSEPKMRHCWNCGEELGMLKRSEWEPGDTCGKTECNREASNAREAEREEAHRRLDSNMGYGDGRW